MVLVLLAICTRGQAGPTPAAPNAPQATASAPASSTSIPSATRGAPATPAASRTPTAAHTPALPPRPTWPPRVVLVSVNGLRADAAQQAHMPNLQVLARRGAYSWSARSVVPPATLPAHAAMLTGMMPAVHGLTWNDYRPGLGPIKVPTLFSLAHAAGFETVMVAGKEKLAHFDVPGTIDRYAFVTNGDQGVADQASVEAEAGFGLLFAHFPNADFFGHSEGWMSAGYLAGLRRTDEALGRLFAALPPHVVIVLTADHGGHGLVHGADIPEDMTVPWLMAGRAARDSLARTRQPARHGRHDCPRARARAAAGRRRPASAGGLHGTGAGRAGSAKRHVVGGRRSIAGAVGDGRGGARRADLCARRLWRRDDPASL
ncbi:MAG: alkaline phosphatase family protein [Anaerolineales bacterium]|nr:alkaline phosphatase family protein [Anaerolineales bacterium]